MNQRSDRCFTCKNGYLKPTGEVVLEEESADQFREIRGKRVYQCDNCKKRRVNMGLNEYIDLPAEVKTEIETDI
ncbi:MAG TPA: hypothetical protein VH415_06605 [Nitrososphaeraceae archaeon]|jgi:hypothetical protein